MAGAVEGNPVQNSQKGAALWAVSWGGEGHEGSSASHWNTWLGAEEEEKRRRKATVP